MISSPYARRGELWRTFNRHFGPDGDPLIMVAKGSSRDFNVTLPQSVVDRAMERDPAAAAAEWMGEFRRDIEDFVSLQVVRGCIQSGMHERALIRAFRYHAFCDPAGGSGGDSFTLAVTHKEQNTVILDCIRERKSPFSPEAVIEEYAKVVRSYRCSSVVGDRFAGEFPREIFRRFGVNYDLAPMNKSELYQNLLPLLNSGGVDLLDSERLVHQLTSLERRTARGGRDSIDHARGGHDNVANCVAGAVERAANGPSTWRRERRPSFAPPAALPSISPWASDTPSYSSSWSSAPDEAGVGWMKR